MNKSKTNAIVMPEVPELAPVVPAVQPTVIEEVIEVTADSAPAIETPEARAQFEQDEAVRAANLAEALATMEALGMQQAEGGDALTNAGIAATALVWERKVNESHVGAMYKAFAKGFNGKAKGGERTDAVDKSALSRFGTFFKPEVAAFIYGTGVNHNWHDTVCDIREGISAGNRKGSLYNALITFNREVVKAEKSALTKITVEHIEALLTKEALDPKTVEARLLALVKQVVQVQKKTGVESLSKIEDAVKAVIKKLSADQLKAIAE
jgi:hypothetical protein